MFFNKKKYTSGDLARFYGITTDTIRFYDKKGILPAMEKGKNEYRSYSLSDLVTVHRILDLKNMGIPLNDIQSIIKEHTLEDTMDYCQFRLQELYKEIEGLRGQCQGLQQFYNNLEKLQETHKQITIEVSPAWILKDLQNGVLEVQKWFAKHSIYGRCELVACNDAYIGEESIGQLHKKTERANVSNCYMALQMPDTQDRSYLNDLDETDRIWNSQLCIHGKIRVDDNKLDSFQELQRIEEFVQKHCFSLKGTILCKPIYMEKNATITYCDVWLPLDDE